MKIITFALLLLIAAMALQVWVYYPLLPDPMATHFGFSGQADGWSSRASFFILTYAILAVVLLSLGTIAWLLPRFPNSAINLPRKDYWLAPERRAETMRINQQVLGWILVLTCLFLLVLDQLVILANLHPPAHLPAAFLWLLGIYLAAVSVPAFWLWRRYRSAPDDPMTSIEPQ
jgi:uncharacterized membrane protein